MDATEFLREFETLGATTLAQKLGVGRSTLYRMKHTAEAMASNTFRRAHNFGSGQSKIVLSHTCPLCEHKVEW